MHQPINFTQSPTHHWCRQEAARQRRVPEKNDAKISTCLAILRFEQTSKCSPSFASACITQGRAQLIIPAVFRLEWR